MRRALLSVVLLVSSVSAALAQTEPATFEGGAEKIRFGIGISYSPLAIPGDDGGRFGTAGMTDFFVPMQFGPYIRFEPEVGIFLKSYQEQLSDSSGAYQRTSNHQIVRTGFGIFYTRQVDKVFQFGIGARIGIMSSEYETHQEKVGVQDTDAHYAIFYLGGSFSVEYYISQHFSIGGELQIVHYTYGAPLITAGSNEFSGYLSNSPQQGVLSTNEVLSARFWF
jgi:hypothetical protein